MPILSHIFFYASSFFCSEKRLCRFFSGRIFYKRSVFRTIKPKTRLFLFSFFIKGQFSALLSQKIGEKYQKKKKDRFFYRVFRTVKPKSSQKMLK